MVSDDADSEFFGFRSIRNIIFIIPQIIEFYLEYIFFYFLYFINQLIGKMTIIMNVLVSGQSGL